MCAPDMTGEPNGSTDVASNEQLDAACAKFAEFGIDFRCPWDSDLDDLELGRFEALKAALEAARIPASITADAVAPEVAVLRYMAECVDTHADKFPVPKHMRSHAAATREIADRLAAAPAHPSPQGEAGPAVIDIEASFWASIKEAALKSPWIPPEYFVNDWVSDICRFLSEPHPLGDAGEPGDLVERPAGWFNPWNETHGYQQVSPEYEGLPGKVPLYHAAVLSSLRAERDAAHAAIEQITWKYMAAESSLAAEKQRVVELERERDGWLEELGKVIMACPMRPDMRMSPASQGVRNLRTAFEAAEQRVAALEGALTGIEQAIEAGRTIIAGDEHTITFPDGTVLRGEPAKLLRDTFVAICDVVRAALRPAETGDARP